MNLNLRRIFGDEEVCGVSLPLDCRALVVYFERPPRHTGDAKDDDGIKEESLQKDSPAVVRRA